MTKKGTRLPDDWQPGAPEIEYAIGLGFTAHEARRIGEDFRDYWIAKTGQAAIKLDWLATWRTWTRKQADREDKQPPRQPVMLGEPQYTTAQSWRSSSGKVAEMLKAMADKGCPHDILDKLFTEGIGITYVNCPFGESPTAVAKNAACCQLWSGAASGYAKRAGYNATIYTADYVAKRRAKLQSKADQPNISGQTVDLATSPNALE